MRVDESQPQTLPKLESLTLSHLDIYDEFLDVLKERHDHNTRLQKLAIRSCRVLDFGYRAKLTELVKKVKWVDVTSVLGPDYDRTNNEPDTD